MSAQGRWGGRLSSRPLPEGPVGGELDDAARAIVVEAWLGRSAAERRAGDSFAVIRDALTARRAPLPWIELAARAIDDEHRHAEICRVVASRYAGRELPPPPPLALVVPPHVGASDDLRHSLHVVGQCALNETAASAFLEACLARAKPPLVRAALRELLADEIDHARIGWAHLAAASADHRRELGPWLPRLVRGYVAEWSRSFAPPPEMDLAAHGVPPKAEIVAAVEAAMEEVVRPGLTHLGYDVDRTPFAVVP